VSSANKTAASRTRPVFESLYNGDPSGQSWLEPLIRLGNRAEEVGLPEEPGWTGPLLRAPEFDFTAPPPLDYLEYLIWNPRRLKWPRDPDGNPREYRPVVQKKRQALLAGNVPAQQEAIRAIRKEQEKDADPDLKGWWVLEGPTTIDCALFAEGVTLFIEGKRDEKSLKVHTNWYTRRIQLYRNLDALRVLPGRAERYYLLALVEQGTPIEAEARAISHDLQFARSSWPHLDEAATQELWSHFLGFSTWQQLPMIGPECGSTDCGTV
jgi:hypothetical protein